MSSDDKIPSLRNRKSLPPASDAVSGSDTKRVQKGNKFKPRVSQAVPLGNLYKNQRYMARFVIILAVVVIIYVSSLKEKERKFARQREILPLRFQPLRCRHNEEHVKGCTPKSCGRYVSDKLITDEETKLLLKFAKSAFKLSDSPEESATFDIHSGTLSNGKRVQDISKDDSYQSQINSHEHLLAFKLVKSKIIQSLVERFDINRNNLHLTSPTFFTQLTNASGWDYSSHQINRQLFPTAFYTTMVHLNDFSKDFKGGRFIFIDDPSTNKSISSIEPKAGRILGFTSGSENTHYTEGVTGAQYSLTILFSCNESAAIKDPTPSPEIPGK